MNFLCLLVLAQTKILSEEQAWPDKFSQWPPEVKPTFDPHGTNSLSLKE